MACSQPFGPVQVSSHQLPDRAVAFPKASQISQEMWIYGIHSSTPCWDKAAWGGLGCTNAESLQKISQIPIPPDPPGSKHFILPWAPKEQLLALLLMAPQSGMRVNVPLSCSTMIYMVLTGVPGFPGEYSTESQMIPASFPTACSHPSLHRGAWQQLCDAPGERGPWALLLLLAHLEPYSLLHLTTEAMLGPCLQRDCSSFLKAVISHTCVLWTRDLLVSVTHEIWTKKIPRLINKFNHFRVPFSASIYSCCCKSQILQWQVSSMSGFEGT